MEAFKDKIVFVSHAQRFSTEVHLVEGLNGKPIQLTRRYVCQLALQCRRTARRSSSSLTLLQVPSNIFKLHIATGKIEILTRNGKLNVAYRNLDWSPNGRQLLFLRIIGALEGEKTDLCVMDMMTRDIRHILQPNTSN